MSKPDIAAALRLQQAEIAGLRRRAIRAEARARANDAAVRHILAVMAVEAPDSYELIAAGLSRFVDELTAGPAADENHRALIAEIRVAVRETLEAHRPMHVRGTQGNA